MIWKFRRPIGQAKDKRMRGSKNTGFYGVLDELEQKSRMKRFVEADKKRLERKPLPDNAKIIVHSESGTETFTGADINKELKL